MHRRLLTFAALGALLVACSAEPEPAAEGAGLAQTPRGVSGAASTAPPAPPGPALAVDVSPAQGQLSASMALPPLPTRAGFDPELSLSYGGGTRDLGEGVGTGFSLSVPSITIDPEYGVPRIPVRADALPQGADPFAAPLSYQGRRLTFVRALDADTFEYRPEIAEQVTRVYYHRAPVEIAALAGPLAFPGGFVVVHADGSRELYPEDPDSYEADLLPTEEGGTLALITRFPLRHRLAPSGDLIEYRYARDPLDQRSYLTAVVFAGGRARYDFTRATIPAPPQRPGYSQGFAQQQTQLYTRVTGSFDDVVAHRTYFVYHASSGVESALISHSDVAAVAAGEFPVPAQAPLGEQSLLVGVLRYGSGSAPITEANMRMPPLRFSHVARSFADLRGQTRVRTLEPPDLAGFGPDFGSEYVDVNQDGLVDIVATESPSSTAVYLNDGRRFARDPEPLTMGDAVPNFRGGQTSLWLPGDFNADGIGDLLQIEGGPGGSGSQLTLHPGRAGARYAAAGMSLTLERPVSAFADARAQVVDINLDGRDDLLLAEQQGTQWTLSLLLNRTKSAGSPDGGALTFFDLTGRLAAPEMLSAPETPSLHFGFDAPENTLADVNGDGLLDLTIARIRSSDTKGLCVFENQGKLRDNVDHTPFPNAKDGLIFGDTESRDPICPGGYFVRIEGAESITDVTSLWQIDVTGDGVADLVNLSRSADTLVVWAGRGREPFRKLGEIPLGQALQVDPDNRWNTQVLDIDGDGQEEIVVYEDDARPRVMRIIDFNRLGDVDTAQPSLLTEIREGQGIRHLVQYATSTDEMLRDRARGRADAAGTPFVMPVVKRLITQVGGAPTAAHEYRYHGPTTDPVSRALLGFAQVEVAEYGDEQESGALTRLDFRREPGGSALVDRVLGDREQVRAVYALPHAATAATAAQLDALSREPPSLAFVSQSAATRAEPDLAAGALLEKAEQSWTTDVPTTGTRPSVYVRMSTAREARFGASCARDDCAATVTQQNRHDACNRVERSTLTEGAIASDFFRVPARSEETVTEYALPCSAADASTSPVALDSLKKTTRRAGPRLLEQNDYSYAQTPFAPSAVTTTASLALRGASERLAAQITPVPPRTVRYQYDAHLNVRSTADDFGTIEAAEFDADDVQLRETKNGRGHTTVYEYDLGALAPSRVSTPRGDLIENAYDPLQRLTAARHLDGATTEFRYQEADRSATRRILVSEARGEGETSETLYVERADGLPIATVEPAEISGSRIASFVEYGRRGGAVRSWLPFLRASTAAALLAAPTDSGWMPESAARTCKSGAFTCDWLDALGRITRTQSPSGRYSETADHAGWGVHSESFDEDGIRKRDTVQRGAKVLAIRDEEGHLHGFDYDEANQLVAVRLAGDLPRETVSDSLGRVLFSAVPQGMSKVFERDDRGRVRVQTIFDRDLKAGGRVETAYDALDRPVSQRNVDAEGKALDEATLAYDEGDKRAVTDIGTLVRATAEDYLAESTFRETFQHDVDGRVTKRRSEYVSAARTETYDEAWTYSVGGLLEAYVDPFANKFAYTLTRSGRRSGVVWTGTGGAGVLARATEFDARGNATQVDRPAHALKHTLEYDADTGLITRSRACSLGSAACLQDDTWSRHGDGRVHTRIDARKSETKFLYSARRALKQATDGARTYSYAANPAGQLTQNSEVPGGALSRGDGPVELPDGFVADTFGRVVQGGSLERVYYDPLGRMRRADVDGESILYSYSALDARIARRVANKHVIYPAPDARDDDREQQSLVRFEGGPVAVVIDGSTSAGLLTDHRGAVEGTVTANGTANGAWHFAPFGSLESGTSGAVEGLGSLELVRSFTGNLRDASTGLVHMNAREYLAEFAGFTTPDPLFASALELCALSLGECAPYGYVALDPINYVDPTGTASRSTKTVAGKHHVEPELPGRVVATGRGVSVYHNYHGGDHAPLHLHVRGGGRDTKIGLNGLPIEGQGELSPAQRTVVRANAAEIRRAIKKIGRWKAYQQLEADDE